MGERVLRGLIVGAIAAGVVSLTCYAIAVMMILTGTEAWP